MNSIFNFPKGRLAGWLMAGVLAGLLAGCGPDLKELRLQGIEQYREKQNIESMATMRHVLEISPDDAVANYYMGLNYRTIAAHKLRDGDVAAAGRQLDTGILYFTQAIKSWPNYMAAIGAKNEALEMRGQYEQAIALAERAASNNRGQAEHFIYLGDEYRQRGDYDNAIKRYKMALATDANNARAYASIGKLFMLSGDRPQALDALRHAYALNPREAGVADALDQFGADSGTYTASHETPAPQPPR